MSLDAIPAEILISSQEYSKKFKKGAGVKTNFLLRKMCGKVNPVYDYQYSGRIGVIDILGEVSKVLMRVIGRHRSLWFIVRLLDTNK